MTKPGFNSQQREGLLLVGAGIGVAFVGSVVSSVASDDGDLGTFLKGGFGAAGFGGLILVLGGIVLLLGVAFGIKDNSLDD